MATRGRPKGRAWGSPAPPVARAAPERAAGDKARASPDAGYLAGMEPSQQEPHARLLFVLMSAVGTHVRVTVKDGSLYEGILSHSSKTDGELGVCLKMARRKDDHESHKVYTELIVPPKELVMVTAARLEFAADKPVESVERGFMTDTAISGFMETRERELIPWLPVEGDSSLESLEATEKDGSGRWDQFATNEKRFGVTTDYDEEFYTTRLDRSRPDFREREREAARLAAEIEKGPAAFAHVAEERGLEVDDSGMDEEEKYSSVIRAPGKYVPPAVRKSEEIKGSAKPATPTETKEPSAETAGKKSSDTLGSESAGSPATPTSQPGTAAARPKPNLPPQLQSVARQPARTGKEIAANIGSVVGDFRDFSQKEKESLLNTRRNIHNTDRNNLLETFRKFSTDFQIKAPIPPDLEPILHKNKKTPPSATSAASPVPSASSPSSAKELTPTSETKDAATTTEAPTARERAATPSAGPAAEKKEFKFNVEAEEFSFNVEATEFVPGGPPSGPKSPTFDRRGPGQARRTPSQSNWQGPRPPMRYGPPGGYEEMQMMAMPPYPPNMGPMDPTMQGGPQGYYPVPGPYMYPPGTIVAPRPAFIPGGAPPHMVMIPPGQGGYMAPYPYPPGGPRPFPQQMIPMQGPPRPHRGGPPMSPPQPGMFPPGAAPPRVPMQFPPQQVVMVPMGPGGMPPGAGFPQGPPTPSEEPDGPGN